MQIKVNLSPIHSAVLFIQVLLDAAKFRSTCNKETRANKLERLNLPQVPVDNFLPHVVFVPSLRRADFGPRSVDSTSIKTEIRGQASTKEAWVCALCYTDMADSSSVVSSEVQSSVTNGEGQIDEEKEAFDEETKVNLPRKSSVLKKDGRPSKRSLQKSVSFIARPEDKRIINGEI